MAVDFQLSFLPNTNRPDLIAWKDNFLDKYQINGLKKEIKKLEYAEKAQIIEDTQKQTVATYDPSIRSSKVKWLPKSPAFQNLYERIGETILINNREHWNFDLKSMHEDIQYTEYHAEDKGHYDWHLDLGPHWASLRKISVTINLSDPKDYDGGALEFDVGGKTKTFAPKSQGTLIAFPSYLMHKVNPITRGVRKSLVLWVGGSHFR